MQGRKAKITTERIAVAYVRVSHAEQVANGSSLEAQRNRLHALATAQERHISAVYMDDGYSAGSLRRPELQRLLTAICVGSISAIYVTKLDRLSRSLADLLEIVKLCEKHNVALISASESVDTSTPVGRMMLQLLGTFAEFERARIGERISDVLADKRERKKVYSRRVPFGYLRQGKELVADPAQQAALAEMRRMHAEGASLRQIAAHVNRLGVRKEPLYAQTVKVILESRMNTAA